MSILATNEDLNKIIKRAVERIGEDHALSRDTTGVTMSNEDINTERELNNVIEESLKNVADEMAEKMVLENTINTMVNDIIKEDHFYFDEPEEGVNNGGVRPTPKDVGSRYVMSNRNRDGYYDDSGLSVDFDENDYDEPQFYSDLESFRDVHPKDSSRHFNRGEEGEKWFNHYKNKFGDLEYRRRKDTTIGESTTELTKKLVKKKLSENSKVPGLDAYEKATKKTGQENKENEKAVKKKFEEYADFEGNSKPEFPHQNNSKTDYESPMYRNTSEDEEFIEDFRGMGLEDANGVDNLGKISDYLEGSSETGNAQVDEDGEDLGNVVSNKLGEKMLKKVARKKEKIAKQKASMSNLRGITPDVQKVKEVNESVVTDMEKMKKLWGYNKVTQ